MFFRCLENLAETSTYVNIVFQDKTCLCRIWITGVRGGTGKINNHLKIHALQVSLDTVAMLRDIVYKASVLQAVHTPNVSNIQPDRSLTSLLPHSSHTVVLDGSRPTPPAKPSEPGSVAANSPRHPSARELSNCPQRRVPSAHQRPRAASCHHDRVFAISCHSPTATSRVSCIRLATSILLGRPYSLPLHYLTNAAAYTATASRTILW